MRTIVYVDGSNRYYGCLKRTPYRWLDLSALCGRLLPDDSEVVVIKYFTAKVYHHAPAPHIRLSANRHTAGRSRRSRT